MGATMDSLNVAQPGYYDKSEQTPEIDPAQ